LFASDELSGFLTACALVKPSKAIAEVEIAGVKKKMKDKGFARAVKREDIMHGSELLGIPVEEHIGNCLRAMQEHAEELGL
jgi:predicted hydrolase (HD superfamily)